MFECTLDNGDLFRKIVVALSDLVEQGNFMVDNNMISFQGMDSSHVSLVALQLENACFSQYRCDSDQCLGIQFQALNKVLKCMTSKDKLSIQAQDQGDTVSFIFESEDKKRYSNFELKLNDIDQQQLGIPDTQYSAVIKMPASEFQRICRDLAAIGDTVSISATKEGVKFSVNGDIGSGDITIQGMVNKKPIHKEDDGNTDSSTKGGNDDDNDEEIAVKEEPVEATDTSKTARQDAETQMDEDDDEDDDMRGGSNKKETETPKGEPEDNDDDEDDDDDDDDDEEEEEEAGKKKKTTKKSKGRKKKKIPTGNVDDDEEEQKEVLIELEEPVQQTFSLRYLNNFTKATGLSTHVTCSMGPDVPLEVYYKIGEAGSIRYYLAPKIDDDE